MSLLAALSLAPFVYAFDVKVPLQYRLQTTFDGFLPVFGGNEGKVDVDLLVNVTPQPAKDGAICTQSAIADATILFDDAPLPLGVDAITQYFPKTTITMSPQGKTLTTDAPNIVAPVRLPGLDVKRFPEIVYIPLEFSTKAVEVGDSWTFTRSFAGSDVNYVAKLSGTTDDSLAIDVTIDQSYTMLEDESLAPVTDRAKAENEVTTTLKGTGKGKFSRKLGVFTQFTMEAISKSVVKPMKSGKATERNLKTIFKVSLTKPLGLGEPVKKEVPPTGFLTQAKGYWTMLSNATSTSMRDLMAALMRAFGWSR